MPDQAKRLSILAQTVKLIREGILGGRWTGELPQERQLCDQLGVSRSTLRRALPHIEAAGLIAPPARGVRRQILAVPTAPRRGASPAGETSAFSVAWLTCHASMPPFIQGLYIELQKRLEAHSCSLAFVVLPEKTLKQPHEYLAGWIDEHQYDAWVLHSMPSGVQQWFSQYKRNAYLFGNRAQGVELSGINVDHESAARHALSMLQRMGHQRIGLVRRVENLVGEAQIETVFRDPKWGALDLSVMACPLEVEMTRVLFERTFLAAGKQRPTALFCTQPHLATFALTWLQRNGINVPEMVSIILLRTQPLLDFVSPSLAHYQINEKRIAPAALPVLLDLVHTGSSNVTEISLIPSFAPGESLAQCRPD